MNNESSAIECCEAEGPQLYSCTRPKGHTGDHIAACVVVYDGMTELELEDDFCERWPNIDAPR